MADLGTSIGSLLQIPGLQELMNQAITQQRQNSSLRTGIMQQAANMLPNSAYGGGGAPNMSAIPQANYSTPPPTSGTDWGKLLSYLALGAGGAGALMKALGGGNGAASGGNLANLVNGLKKIFGGNKQLGNPNAPATGGDPFGNNLPSYDPFYNFDGFTGLASDPSNGTGIGPGMKDFYSSLSPDPGDGGE